MVDIAAPVMLKRQVLAMRRLAPAAMTLGLWAMMIEGLRLAAAAL
jgi:hypothetical protein